MAAVAGSMCTSITFGGRARAFVLCLCLLGPASAMRQTGIRDLVNGAGENRSFQDLPKDFVATDWAQSKHLTTLLNLSLAQREGAASESDAESEEVVAAVLAVTMAMVSIVTTAWDLWEKWNAVMMLQYALTSLRDSPWTQKERYERYDSLALCTVERIDESVDTMGVAATYYQLLYYAATQCARPDVHINWFATSHRCTRDYAQERVEEMYEQVCSPHYGLALIGTVDMLLANDTVAAPDGCACLAGHACDGKAWCWVPKGSNCPDVQFSPTRWGYSSHTPCLAERMANPDKARALMKSTCTICHHGFYSNAGIIEAQLFDGTFGEGSEVSLRDEQQRRALKEQLAATLRSVHNISAAHLSIMPAGGLEDPDGAPPPDVQRAFVAILRWEALMAFDKRCKDFKDTLPTSERTLMTGEDLGNEKIARLLVDGRLAKLGTSVGRTGEKMMYPLVSIFNRSKQAWTALWNHTSGPTSGPGESLLQAAYQRHRVHLGQRSDLWEASTKFCTEESFLKQDLREKAEAAGPAITRLQETCDAVHDAVPREEERSRTMLDKVETGPSCQCTGLDHKVFCGDVQVAMRKFLVRNVVKTAGCHTPYCAPEARALAVRARFLRCGVVAGAVGRWSRWFRSAGCKCQRPDHVVFCGGAQVAGRKFSLEGDILANATCQAPYCAAAPGRPASAGLAQGDSLAQLSRVHSAAVAGTDPWSVLLWVPLQLAQLMKISAQGALDKGMALWWFAFNNVYGAFGTVEAVNILMKGTKLVDKFAQWTGIVTFFIWLINDAIFTGVNVHMCPKITQWIELMDDVRPALDDEAQESLTKTESTLKRRKTQKHMWCNRSVGDVRKELVTEIAERSTAVRRLRELHYSTALGWELHDPRSLASPDDDMAELLQRHEHVTLLLEQELKPARVCSIAASVMQEDWRADGLDEVTSVTMYRSACSCEPPPSECRALSGA